jgi:hypothetical protein
MRGFLFIVYMDNDIDVFDGKSFKSLCKDIYNNADDKRKQLDKLIRETVSLIKTVQDAVILVPVVKEYYDVGVRNDEQLIKLAAIVQRIKSAENTSEGINLGLSEAEKDQLLKEINKLSNDIAEPIVKVKKDKDKE